MKLEFALRSCLGLGVLVFMSLDAGVDDAITHEKRHVVGTAFSAFVCIITSDVTLGATVMNILAVLRGAVLATAASSIIFLSFGNPATLSQESVYPLIFCSCFGLNLLDIPPLGKKLALSLMAINLINRSTPSIATNTTSSVASWWLFVDVLLGCACALIGTVFPWPILASSILESKGASSSALLASLFRETLTSWRCGRINDFEEQLHSAQEDDVVFVEDVESSVRSVAPRLLPRSKPWRLLIIVFRATRRARQPGLLLWQQGSRKRGCVIPISRSCRAQLRLLVEEDLLVMQARAREAQYGPHRRRALDRYAEYVALVRELLPLHRNLESRLAALEPLRRSGASSAIMLSFFSDPAFRAALWAVGECLALCLVDVGRWLGDDSKHSDRRLFQAHAALSRAVAEFDAPYKAARYMTYYGPNSTPHVPEVLLSFNCLVSSLLHGANKVNKFCDVHLSRDDASVQAARAVVGGASCSSVRLLVPLTRKTLVTALSIAGSMTCGAIFGLQSARQQPFLASFTVAYVAGGVVTGINIATSLLRISGTAAACLYTLIIATLSQSWIAANRPFDQRVFGSCAVVAALFPSTIVRASSGSWGYAGLVAGFSTALLLLAPLTVSLVIDRLIDTLFGVAIFLIFEITCSATFSEAAVVGGLVKGVESLDAAAGATIRRFVGGDKSRPVSAFSPPPSLPSKELLLFSSLEPSILRAKIFSSSLLERCLDELSACHENASFLSSIVDEIAQLRESALQALPLQAHLASVDCSVSAAVQTILSSLTVGDSITRPFLQPSSSSVEALVATLHGSSASSGGADESGLARLDAVEARVMARFHQLVMGLQARANKDHIDVVSQLNNHELMLICAFLGCFFDFLSSLRRLHATASDLRYSHLVRRRLLK